MSELKGISASKSAKEAAMQEIKDREMTKDVKGQAMAELKKVADIKDKVGAADLPIGAAEKVDYISLLFLINSVDLLCPIFCKLLVFLYHAKLTTLERG